jgi:hypothetical protein
MAQARIDIGFQGGPALALRVDDDAIEKLMAALADDNAKRWHALESDEERITVDLSQVVYVRRETGNRTVGF